MKNTVKTTDYTKVFYYSTHRRWLSNHRFWKRSASWSGLNTQCKNCVKR